MKTTPPSTVPPPSIPPLAPLVPPRQTPYSAPPAPPVTPIIPPLQAPFGAFSVPQIVTGPTQGIRPPPGFPHHAPLGAPLPPSSDVNLVRVVRPPPGLPPRAPLGAVSLPTAVVSPGPMVHPTPSLPLHQAPFGAPSHSLLQPPLQPSIPMEPLTSSPPRVDVSPMEFAPSTSPHWPPDVVELHWDMRATHLSGFGLIPSPVMSSNHEIIP